jgi:hypothetical protein
MSHYILIMYLTQIFVVYVGIVGIRRYSYFIKPLRIVVWYIVCSVIVDCIKDVMIFYNIRTLWINHWFSLLELMMFILVFNYWRASSLYFILIWVSFFAYLLLWIIGKFTFEPFGFADTYSESISQTIQIAFGIPLLIAIIGDENSLWKSDQRFWVISGIVFYSAAAFFLFSLFNVLLTIPRQIMRMIWPLNDLFIVVQYIFFLRAFLCKPITISQVLVQGETEGKTN